MLRLLYIIYMYSAQIITRLYYCFYINQSVNLYDWFCKQSTDEVSCVQCLNSTTKQGRQS